VCDPDIGGWRAGALARQAMLVTLPEAERERRRRARRQKIAPQRRREIARNAALARWSRVHP